MNEAEEREEALFEAALRLRTEQRAEYLGQVCGGDADLRRRVEALLGAFDRAGGFLKDPAAPIPRPSLPQVERPGDRIGRYKLLQQIGEGGMGVVYMAEQEEPVRRRVALKVIKLGMDTRSVIARFEAERQALALMDHPNIARVLDAGATETGRPYFVMELVQGIKITDYCDENNLSTDKRLGLFIQVCHAVQHAHQKGIIHRDLKPSNILVSLHDGVALPKVIDFGIAKATSDQRLTDKTLFTAFEQFIGTPAYMSPEQAEMSGVDIDTRSDIYSLGVLLYELLTGRTPFDGKKLLESGLEAMRKTIREKEPARPSTTLQTLPGEDLTTTARRRGTEISALIGAIRGDLDWIAIKCLEKDRARRYETANGLARDVHRHLESEPVTARPPNALYRLRKLVRRHKRSVAAALAIMVVLIIGTLASLWEAFRAMRAERDQSRLRAEAQTQAQLLKDMLKGVSPGVARGRDTRLLRDLLDQTAQRIGEELKGQPAAEADMRETLGDAYLAIGDYTNALNMNKMSLALRESPNAKDPLGVAASLNNIGEALEGLGRVAEAENYIRQALDIRQKLLGPTNLYAAGSHHNLGMLLIRQKKLTEAETHFRQAATVRKKLLGDDGLEVADSLYGLGLALWKQGKFPESEEALRQALAIYSNRHVSKHPTVVETLNQFGWMLREQGKLSEAETAFRQALEVSRGTFEPGHPGASASLEGLAQTLTEEGKAAEGEEYCRQALAIIERSSGQDPQAITIGLCLDRALQAQGKPAEAEAAFQHALALSRKLKGEQHPELIDAHKVVGWRLFERGELAEAEEFFRLALAATQVKEAQPAPGLLNEYVGLGFSLEGQGKPGEAEGCFRQALAVANRPDVGQHPDLVLGANLGLGWTRRDQGDFAEAERCYRKALVIGCEALKNSNVGVVRPFFGALASLGSELQARACSLSADPLLAESLQLVLRAPNVTKFADGLNEIGWILATAENPTKQDAAMAIELAQKAVTLTARTNGEYLDTWAAAYAAAGQFTNAVHFQQEAIALTATSLERDDFGDRLRCYQSNTLFRDGDPLASRALTLLKAGKGAEAESAARGCLARRQQCIPDDWRTFSALSLLGGCLLEQQKYTAAEPLLVSGYMGIKQREGRIPPEYRQLRLGEALERLVELYKRTDRPSRAVETKQQLAELDAAKK
jgi:serine/threonine protein kinase/Tfp pilus assembly protein PilF